MPLAAARTHLFGWTTLNLFVVCLLGWSTPAPAQEPVAGTVKVLTGTATAGRGDQRRPLAPGAAIFESDTVRTGPDSQLGLTLRDETRLSLGPNTEVTLATFAYAPADQRFGLVVRVARGLFEYISGRLSKLAPESIRIETPSSIIGVRGTHLLIGAALP